MKKSIYIFCILLFGGCASIERDTVMQPELLNTYPLPTVPQSIYDPHFQIEAEMLVDEKGNVPYAKLIDSTGDKMWNSMAVASIEKWKFVPASYKNSPVKALIRRKIKVNFGSPVYMNLIEMICDSSIKADSAYQALLNGSDFRDVSGKYAESSSGSNSLTFQNVDINCYPQEVQEALVGLNPNEFTKPLHYGEKYVIFKRVQMIE
jgi:Gram-negative bacterial TonB protein C-terminal